MILGVKKLLFRQLNLWELNFLQLDCNHNKLLVLSVVTDKKQQFLNQMITSGQLQMMQFNFSDATICFFFFRQYIIVKIPLPQRIEFVTTTLHKNIFLLDMIDNQGSGQNAQITTHDQQFRFAPLPRGERYMNYNSKLVKPIVCFSKLVETGLCVVRAGLCNMHCTLNIHPDQPGRNRMYQR